MYIEAVTQVRAADLFIDTLPQLGSHNVKALISLDLLRAFDCLLFGATRTTSGKVHLLYLFFRSGISDWVNDFLGLKTDTHFC